ncbi:hypothetical protein QWY16_10670 [Planococcus shenhongbingii]|uniref:hypothetical protein n=1 Tax=Planococcus shenhongbingii TaxID=3058398 RepID=UPI00262405D1|nr:hypothetical protein [Planococcus sp. N016]WKA56977.1 hypothetical protein QWY16_10670 [Planococcus sp. N016]
MSGKIDEREQEDGMSFTFRNFVIAVLLLIIFSLVSFIVSSGLSLNNLTIDGNLFGLSDSFWGSLSGALIAGLIAIWISQREHNRISREKKEEAQKILLNLKENAEELFNEINKAQKINNELYSIPNPYENVITHVDEKGYEHYENLPPEYLEEEYHNVTSKLKKTNIKSYNYILDLLEEVKMIELKELEIDSYKQVLTFKQKSRKVLEPALNFYINGKRIAIDKNEMNEIYKIIFNFYQVVS